jgi:hypothetical protein
LVGLVDLILYYGTNGWQTSEEIVQNNPQFSTNCGINYIGQKFFAISYLPTSSVPIGNWYTNKGGILNGVTPVYVSEGLCPVSVVVDTIQAICSQTTPALGTVVLDAFGGTPPYIFYLISDTQSQSNTSGNFLLPSGTYSTIVQDSDGVGSQPLSFTIPTTNGVDVLFGIDSCVTSNLTTSWLNQISGPSANPVIQNGESKVLNASMSNVIDFSFLPDGASFTGRIRILLSSYFTGGDSSHSFPTTSNIVVTPTINVANIQTNGVSTNFMSSVTPTLINNPGEQYNGTNGIWFKNGSGNVCCLDKNTEGTKWFQSYEWISPILTFNNTTILTNIFSINTKNSVPYYNVKCTNNTFCGAYLTNGLLVELKDLVKVSGCINVSGSKKLIQGSVKNNSDGDAGWEFQPLPIC